MNASQISGPPVLYLTSCNRWHKSIDASFEIGEPRTFGRPASLTAQEKLQEIRNLPGALRKTCWKRHRLSVDATASSQLLLLKKGEIICMPFWHYMACTTSIKYAKIIQISWFSKLKISAFRKITIQSSSPNKPAGQLLQAFLAVDMTLQKVFRHNSSAEFKQWSLQSTWTRWSLVPPTPGWVSNNWFQSCKSLKLLKWAIVHKCFALCSLYGVVHVSVSYHLLSVFELHTPRTHSWHRDRDQTAISEKLSSSWTL